MPLIFERKSHITLAAEEPSESLQTVRHYISFSLIKYMGVLQLIHTSVSQFLIRWTNGSLFQKLYTAVDSRTLQSKYVNWFRMQLVLKASSQ